MLKILFFIQGCSLGAINFFFPSYINSRHGLWWNKHSTQETRKGTHMHFFWSGVCFSASHETMILHLCKLCRFSNSPNLYFKVVRCPYRVMILPSCKHLSSTGPCRCLEPILDPTRQANNPEQMPAHHRAGTQTMGNFEMPFHLTACLSTLGGK